MDAVENYGRKWIKRELEKPELDTLCVCIKAFRSCTQKLIENLRCTINTRISNLFPEVLNALFYLHDKYVIVPADKTSNDIFFV